MKWVIAVVLPLAIGLVGCSAPPKGEPGDYGHWVDASGRGRGIEEGKTDRAACYAVFSPPSAHVSDRARQLELDKALACMRDRGWKLVED